MVVEFEAEVAEAYAEGAAAAVQSSTVDTFRGAMESANSAHGSNVEVPAASQLAMSSPSMDVNEGGFGGDEYGGSDEYGSGEYGSGDDGAWWNATDGNGTGSGDYGSGDYGGDECPFPSFAGERNPCSVEECRSDPSSVSCKVAVAEYCRSHPEVHVCVSTHPEDNKDEDGFGSGDYGSGEYGSGEYGSGNGTGGGKNQSQPAMRIRQSLEVFTEREWDDETKVCVSVCE